MVLNVETIATHSTRKRAYSAASQRTHIPFFWRRQFLHDGVVLTGCPPAPLQTPFTEGFPPHTHPKMISIQASRPTRCCYAIAVGKLFAQKQLFAEGIARSKLSLENIKTAQGCRGNDRGMLWGSSALSNFELETFQ